MQHLTVNLWLLISTSHGSEHQRSAIIKNLRGFMVSETGGISFGKYITIYVYFTFRKPFFTLETIANYGSAIIESVFNLANIVLHLSLSFFFFLLFLCLSY